MQAAQAGDDPPAPQVTVEASVSASNFERGDTHELYVRVHDGSAIGLANVSVRLINGDDFELEAVNPCDTSAGACDLRAYTSATREFKLTTRDDAGFGDQKLNIEINYTWLVPLSDSAVGGQPTATPAPLAGQTFDSSQSTVVELTVKRHFEDEAGIVSGGASALYLLLPVLLFLSMFQVARQIVLDRQALSWPTVDVKAVPLIVVLALMAYVALNGTGLLPYTGDLPTIKEFLEWAGGALVLTVLATFVIWAGRAALKAYQDKWRFDGKETYVQAIEKAYGRPCGFLMGKYKRDAISKYPWVSGTAGGVMYEGILLQSEEDSFGLGAALQARPTSEKDSPTFITEVVDRSGNVHNPEELVRLAKAGLLTITPANVITKEGQELSDKTLRVTGSFEKGDPKNKSVTGFIRYV